MTEQKLVRLSKAEGGLQYFFRYLKSEKETVTETISLNDSRHFVVKCAPLFDKQKRFYIIFQKDDFFTFSQKFPNFGDTTDQTSKSINVEWLDKAIEFEQITKSDSFREIKEIILKLVFIYPDGRMIWTYPSFFKKYAEKHKLVRTQERMNFKNKGDYSGQTEPVNETTYSLPFSLLQEIKQGAGNE